MLVRERMLVRFLEVSSAADKLRLFICCRIVKSSGLGHSDDNRKYNFTDILGQKNSKFEVFLWFKVENDLGLYQKHT